MLNSKKLFSNSDQDKNATLVQYANEKIFAVGRAESQLHVLDLELNVMKVVDHQFEETISVMVSTGSYVAIGESNGSVTVFDNKGNHVLVSKF